MLELRPHHLGLSVPNLEESIAWYGRALGFALEKTLYLEAIPARVAFLRRGEFRLELFEVPGANPLPEERKTPHADLKTHGTKHLAFAVEDVEAAVKELEGRGVEVVMRARIEGGPMAFIRDNAGNLLELVQVSSF
ncbi:methylmalonyl-CoA epimerase [Meiothermus luteus]|jgi:methylmalonyl-CoA/ethylmalonyl-CoA epimerase|uniref:Methylmalonyl-CoA epimerase n=1 Tax=Meiothermus luteus TaxID=2026184 RepID=A0A399ED52_9DEIN|nr:VOC family protein [Meiothermus luteus]RIH81473.1 methylmalonyl-CoA epimerase [Meiothermus luteus]RMH55994.1 MAG: VOC family protein [Deinococcota bacterium]